MLLLLLVSRAYSLTHTYGTCHAPLSLSRSVDAQKKDAETDEKIVKELQSQIKRLTTSLQEAGMKNLEQFKLVEVRKGHARKACTDARTDAHIHARTDAQTHERTHACAVKHIPTQAHPHTYPSIYSSTQSRTQHLRPQENEAIKKALEEDIIMHKIEEQQLRKRNYLLEKQKEKAAMQSASWQFKYQETLETVKLKEMESNELTKQVRTRDRGQYSREMRGP